MKRARQAGAALLIAMLLVALVATVAAASLWSQWRDGEVEAAEHARAQSAWVLTGALDWARAILREDAVSGAIDHLDEPWAAPDVLAAAAAPTGDAVLSGQIVDLQSRLNVTNIAALGRISQPALRTFTRLFDTLGLPQHELARLAGNLRLASDIGPGNALAGEAAPAPQRMDDLVGMGLSPRTVAALQPFVTVLPGPTGVNLNTAGAEVIYSAIEGIGMADAQRVVAARAGSPFRTIADAGRLLPGGDGLATSDFSVGSRFFEVRARLRTDAGTVRERSVVQRDGLEVAVLQRSREP